MANVYLSDTHFNHLNIIEYCERPFKDLGEMHWRMYQSLHQAAVQGHAIHHLGDVSIRLPELVSQWGPLPESKQHILVSGNHDRTSFQDERRSYYQWFGKLVGTELTWDTNTLLVNDNLNGHPVKVLLSHLAQRNLQGADFNLYGHFHDHWRRTPERFLPNWAEIANSDKHFNVSVEWHDYAPVRLSELVARRLAGELMR